MSPKSFAPAARTIFLEAVEGHPPDEWPAFLEAACGDNAVLRRQVERLLAAHGHVDDFMARPAAVSPSAVPIHDLIGQQIGRYMLLEQIGEGGMGVVYVAEQIEPFRRKVALKLIKPGMDSRQVIARFEAERQALALMDHPHIAKVLDAGTTEGGRPYFVMELVRGLPVTDYCDQARLPPRERLSLMATVCQAVEHAHQRGIIHRDLKPGNLLVTLHDGSPVVKVIDFGVAKALHQQLSQQTIYTQSTQMIGTPLYMSPEQAELSRLDVDTRSDVYSLGVVLYELLTGHPPFDPQSLQQAGFDELRRIIREDEPPRPSARVSTLDQPLISTVTDRRGLDGAGSAGQRRLVRHLRGEPDWIVMKALEKDRAQRYQSASDLGADIRRYLDHLPIQARPASLVMRALKWRRRNPVAFLAGLASVVLLITALVPLQV
jgi:serine/threonine protein kinase